MKKTKTITITAVVGLLLIVVLANVFTSGNKERTELTGTWVAASDHMVYPDVITLNSDGTGSVEGLKNFWGQAAPNNLTLTWYSDERILTIITELGEKNYDYRVSGDHLYIDDYLYFKK